MIVHLLSVQYILDDNWSNCAGAGLETPDMIELRKRRIEADMEGGETPSLPYTILPERRNERIGASMMGSAHTYDLGKVGSAYKWM